MVTLEAINSKIARLQRQAAVAEKHVSIGLTKIHDLMQKHGLSVADIESFVGKRRGRKPSKAAANGAAKSARVQAQPVAAKYADPKSGATWSGRGRAPAWIKGVKDRSRFLISGREEQKANGTKAASAKTASVKRPAAKKASPQRSPAPATRTPARKAVASAKKGAVSRKVAVKNIATVAENATTSVAASE